MRMKTLTQAFAGIIAISPWFALAFNSGSTGADGSFSPTVSQQIVLPPSGVFNFTNVNIPAGVTITFAKNAANTPVVILATGDVAIAGTINVSGNASPGVGAGGSGALGDDGMVGIGGPGGYDGGRGGLTGQQKAGGSGLGPGGGAAGVPFWFSGWGGSSTVPNAAAGGGGAGFGAAGTDNYWSTTTGNTGFGGPLYGSNLLLPLIGGSGGGGGSGSATMAGSGGGGGGGAILIAASGTINVAGSILSNGGASGAVSGGGYSCSGGGGSGGAIRLVATAVAGNGTISATGGAAGTNPYSYYNGGAGAIGRIRIEAETLTRTAQSTPNTSLDIPGQLFVAGLPTLTITSVAGTAAPANPTGNADITLPITTANPVTVEFRTTNVPVGNIVKLTVTPAYGNPVTALTPALAGTTESATASVQITLPTGPSTLQAQTTYTIVASLGDALSRYANNERVEQVQLSSVMGGQSTVTLITVSGKEYQVPAALLTMMPS